MYDRKEILTLLESVKPGLAKNTSIEQSDVFVFQDNKIITYNDKISIVIPFKSDLNGNVPADELYKTLSKIKEDKIKIFIKENQLCVHSKKVKAKLKLIDIENIIIPDIPTKWKSIPENFIEGLSLCIFSASDDEVSGFLNCLSIQNNSIVSSDNFRISQFNMDNDMDNFLLPVSSAKQLVKYIPAKYVLSDSWIYFQIESGAVFCSRIVDVSYPNVTEMLSTVKGTKFKLPEEIKELKQSVELSSVFADGEFDTHKKIQVTIKNGKIICKGEKESGSIQTKTNIDYEGDNISFIINPIFFLQIIEKFASAIISKNILLFQSKNFKHLLSLFDNENE